MKQIIFKVFAPGNRTRRQFVLQPPQGKRFSQQGIEQLQNEMANKVEAAFPGHDYRFVPIGSMQFNFVHEDECRKCHEASEDHLRENLEILPA